LSEPLAEAVDVSRVFGHGEGAVTALRQATCTIRAGDRIALMGPSGSGKSTLLHLLAGLDDPTSGMIRWPALGRKEELRPSKISFVFQTESLLTPLSVLENIEIPLLLQGQNGGGARDAALRALKAMDLEQLADKLPEEISGGQAQRVAVARSLVNSPRMILADEPTGQLDQVTASHLIELLLVNLARDSALIIATHDNAVAKRMPKIWRIEHGVLAEAS
jgi:putative ABC transport system ATP-binding protein/lipoprotein-releasing system ATP-binding protein